MADSDKPWEPTPELNERYHDFIRRMLDSILDDKLAKKVSKNAK